MEWEKYSSTKSSACSTYVSCRKKYTPCPLIVARVVLMSTEIKPRYFSGL